MRTSPAVSHLPLPAIARYQMPRTEHELPKEMGLYERLAPHTPQYNAIMKQKRQCVRTQVPVVPTSIPH